MKAIIQNLAIEYEDTGSGKAILLLHGWQDNLHTFDAMMPFLSSKNRIIRLDLPGFGQSENPKGTWNLDDYVKFVRSFLDKKDIKISALIGHSFGGRIAIKGVSTKIISAEKMILIDSAGLVLDRKFRRFTLKIITKIGGILFKIPPLTFWRDEMRNKLYDSIGSDYLNTGILKDTYLNIIAEDLSVNARLVEIPTLLIWGEDDTATPLSIGMKLSKLIYGSILKVLPGTGHFVYKEKPAEVAKLIQEFL